MKVKVEKSIQQMNDEPTCRCQRNPLIDTLGIQEPVRRDIGAHVTPSEISKPKMKYN